MSKICENKILCRTGKKKYLSPSLCVAHTLPGKMLQSMRYATVVAFRVQFIFSKTAHEKKITIAAWGLNFKKSLKKKKKTIQFNHFKFRFFILLY
jgi:hypothetical protein